MIALLLIQIILLVFINKGSRLHCALFLKIPIKDCVSQEQNAKTFFDQIKVIY